MVNVYIKDLAIAGSLTVGLLEDLRTQKVRNSVVISIFTFTLLIAIFQSGLSGLMPILASIGFCFFMTLPFFITGVLGAGDCKFLISISPLLLWKDCLGLLFLGLIWGALMGVFIAVLKGQMKTVLLNSFQLVFRISRGSQLQLHKIPFLVALAFGWFSLLTLKTHGVWP